jgi:DNA-3-methyladenine glycosylase
MVRERSPGRRLARSFFARPALDVAPDLLGRMVRHRSADGVVTVRLTEVEAYAGAGEDPASHAHRGPTPRSAVMFGPPAHLYVYFSYGMHWCANVVCGPKGSASAVLLRGAEVVEGLALAQSRRPQARAVADLARGPAKLTTVLGLDGGSNGLDLATRASPVTIHAGARADGAAVRTGPRVGISSAAEVLWRFWLDGEPTVSSSR